jgi:hypothetical protein
MLFYFTDAAYWNQLGQQLLLDELGKQRINSQAKNIIFFLGDGPNLQGTKGRQDRRRGTAHVRPLPLHRTLQSNIIIDSVNNIKWHLSH